MRVHCSSAEVTPRSLPGYSSLGFLTCWTEINDWSCTPPCMNTISSFGQGLAFFLFLGGEIYTKTRLCWFSNGQAGNGRRTAEITTVGGEVQTRSKQGATTFEIYKPSCHFNGISFLSLNTKSCFLFHTLKGDYEL